MRIAPRSTMLLAAALSLAAGATAQAAFQVGGSPPVFVQLSPIGATDLQHLDCTKYVGISVAVTTQPGAVYYFYPWTSVNGVKTYIYPKPIQATMKPQPPWAIGTKNPSQGELIGVDAWTSDPSNPYSTSVSLGCVASVSNVVVTLPTSAPAPGGLGHLSSLVVTSTDNQNTTLPWDGAHHRDRARYARDPVLRNPHDLQRNGQ